MPLSLPHLLRDGVLNPATHSISPDHTSSRATFPIPPASRNLTIIAWGTTILISALPDIICFTLSHRCPPWLTYGKMVLLLALVLSASIRTSLRPLRGFFAIMLAVFALQEVRPHVDFTHGPLQALFGNSIFDHRMQAEQTGKFAVALLLIAALFCLGYKRRSFFLTRGNLRARIEPVPLLGFPKPDPWPSFGLQWGFYIAAALAVIQYLGLRPSGSALAHVAPMLPSILFYAALNAFNEELTYRAPMLATLEGVGGTRHALWMSAYFFGIAHYFGTPGGLLGGISSIFMGWILGKAMVETRGLFWSWWIHFLSDVVIFVFLAITLGH